MPLKYQDREPSWDTEATYDGSSTTPSRWAAIAAAEFMNEPTIVTMGVAPKSHDAAAYGNDRPANGACR